MSMARGYLSEMPAFKGKMVREQETGEMWTWRAYLIEGRGITPLNKGSEINKYLKVDTAEYTT